jgi:hypothetical protein
MKIFFIEIFKCYHNNIIGPRIVNGKPLGYTILGTLDKF